MHPKETAGAQRGLSRDEHLPAPEARHRATATALEDIDTRAMQESSEQRYAAAYSVLRDHLAAIIENFSAEQPEP